MTSDSPDVPLAGIRAQLAAPPAFLVLPPSLQAEFHAWRMRDLARYLRIAAFPVVLVTLVLTLVSARFFTGELDARDTRLWTLGSGLACFLLAGGVLLMQRAVIQRHYVTWASLLGVILTAKFTLMPQLLRAPVAIAAESAFCMIFIVVVCLAMRLRLQRAALVCLAGGALGLLLARVAGVQAIDWRGFSYYYVAMLAVCLFVLWLMEEREKTAFLQSLLLDDDARQLDALNRELARLASLDSLSGLANRRSFDRALVGEWERLRRASASLAVLFIDVDHFKAYNDHYGHGAGDEALRAVAGALQSALRRPADLAARYGGEEFVILLPDTDLEGAADVGQRVLDAVDALALPHEASDTAAHVTVSIGVAAVVPGENDTAVQLLDRADAALYAAKRAGRYRVSLAAAAD